MTTRQEIEQWLQEGIIAAKSGQYEQARFRLLDVVEQDQTNETAWFWLYQLFDRYEDKYICLENLITINPYNEWAKKELLNYVELSAFPEAGLPTNLAGPRPSQSAKLISEEEGKNRGLSTRSPRPVTLKLVAAFWLGISIAFLANGIMAFSQWLTSNASARTFTSHIISFQILEMLIAIIFVIAGIVGLSVAVMLFFRSMVGFYGSILLALGLLLVGPLVSLIAAPPHYLTMICTGGISGMIVLLTLASQPGFKETQRANNISD